MAARIAITSTQHAGTTATPRGEEPQWRVVFRVDGDHYLTFETTFTVIGPTSPLEANVQAAGRFRAFIREIAAAAESFSPPGV
jgi:hypothetical protein